MSATSLKGSSTGEPDHEQAKSDVNGNSLDDDGIVELVEENNLLKQSLLEVHLCLPIPNYAQIQRRNWGSGPPPPEKLQKNIVFY